MEAISVMLWSMGGGFAVLFGVFLTMWHGMNQKFESVTRDFKSMDEKFETKFSDMDKKFETKFSDMDKKFETKFFDMDKKIDALQVEIKSDMAQLESRLTIKIDKLDEKVTDVDRRLCRLEGAFSAKDCCAIKDDRHLRKAE